MNLCGVETSCAPKAKKRPNSDDWTFIDNYSIEYAKSGQASCAVCLMKIAKNEIRIKKMLGGKTKFRWHHIVCFHSIGGDLGFTSGSAELLPGLEDLRPEDKESIVQFLNSEFDAISPKKPRLDVDRADEEEVKSQNDQLHKYKELLSKVAKEDLTQILEFNGQKVPQGQERMLNLLSDCMAFGSPTPCPKCRGQIRFDNTAYICDGQSPELCVYRTRDPKRVATRLPLYVMRKYTFLFAYKCKVQNRCLPNYQRFADSLISKEKDAMDIPRMVREKPRLHNMWFLVLGKMQRSQEKIKKIVGQAGGKITREITDIPVAVISSKKIVDEMIDGNIMQWAKILKIQVVSEEFLDEFMNVDPIEYIETQSICDWGSDPRKRIRELKSPYEKTMSKSKTLIPKNGIFVDPDSKLQRVAHVYEENDIKYDSVLALTDIQQGKNSFYKLQLLEADTGNQFWLFRSWGRTGTTIGDKKIDKFHTLRAAKYSFEEAYLDKTGNEWTEREVLVKRPGKYYPVEVDNGKGAKSLAEFSAIPSTLDPRVQDLMKSIFDIAEMNKMMLGFKLDLEKMPLGKLSQQQVKASYGVLNEISDLILTNGSTMKLIEASNRFYTLIPHSFGVSVPPILNTLNQVCNKMDMVQTLLEIEVAYNLLTANGNVETSEVANPIDLCYNQLKTDLVPLEKTDPEYAYLEKYVRNTHGETHNYKLDIETIFKVRRSGEAERYERYKTLHNRQLLWHGSRLTNFVGILSNGLRIAPLEAPCNGHMFGKGLYFTNVVSKAANFSALPTTGTGLLLLCEVALGNTKICTSEEYILNLPPDRHSTFGMGRTYPNPDESWTREDGVVVPLGRLVKDSSFQSSLCYDEFIVYNEAQAEIQYLFKVNFNYKV